MDWLLMLFMPATPHENYTGRLAAEAAYVTMQPVTPITPGKHRREDCPEPPNGCGGKGLVRSGDDQEWLPCPHCEPPEKAGAKK